MLLAEADSFLLDLETEISNAEFSPVVMCLIPSLLIVAFVEEANVDDDDKAPL